MLVHCPFAYARDPAHPPRLRRGPCESNHDDHGGEQVPPRGFVNLIREYNIARWFYAVSPYGDESRQGGLSLRLRPVASAVLFGIIARSGAGFAGNSYACRTDRPPLSRFISIYLRGFAAGFWGWVLLSRPAASFRRRPLWGAASKRRQDGGCRAVPVLRGASVAGRKRDRSFDFAVIFHVFSGISTAQTISARFFRAGLARFPGPGPSRCARPAFCGSLSALFAAPSNSLRSDKCRRGGAVFVASKWGGALRPMLRARASDPGAAARTKRRDDEGSPVDLRRRGFFVACQENQEEPRILYQRLFRCASSSA